MTSSLLQALFWLSIGAVWYAYFGYPLVLMALSRVRPSRDQEWPAQPGWEPTVSLVIPVHNERSVIEDKLTNARMLSYPAGRLEVLFVADGCTDGTAEYLRERQDDLIRVIEIHQRGGKAGALNAGLAQVRHEIVVFSDASIQLEPGALQALVRPFQDPRVGCASGEDHIAQMGGEGLYGRYELWLRRLESRLHSIVGASGSFYAQRRLLCDPFGPGLAPDFLSVLRTVERGYRAVAVADARGTMRATASHRDEFDRKVRTLLRGMTTLREYAHLMNPVAYGWFAFALVSHKLIRWLVPVFLALALVSSALLAPESPLYLTLLILQVAFYALAAGTAVSYPPIARSLPVRIAAYFTTVTVATMSAWVKFLAGTRQELWSPTRR